MVDPAVAGPVKAAIGLAPEDEIVGFIYLGYASGPPGVRDTPTRQVRYLA
jgi:hypothetical protein